MGATSQKELDRYRTQYSVEHRPPKRRSGRKLSYSNLRSPSAGTVADVNVKVGDVIQQGQVFTSLVQNASWKQGLKCRRCSRRGCSSGQPVLLSAPWQRRGDCHRVKLIPSIHASTTTQGSAGEGGLQEPDRNTADGQRLRTRVCRSRPRNNWPFPLPLSPRPRARASSSVSAVWRS